MTKNNQDEPIFNKIEIDSNQEPKIVTASSKEVLKNTNDNLAEVSEQKKRKLTSRGKQLSMNKIFGLESFNTSDSSFSKRQKLFSRILTTLFCIFVVGVLFWTAYNDFGTNNNISSAWETFKTFKENWYYFVFALLSLSGCYLFKGFKLSILCKKRTGKFHFKTCLETAIIGHYYNSVTPLAVGGQPFEIYYLAKHGVRGGESSSLPVATVFLLQFSFVILGVISLVSYNYDLLGTKKFLMLDPAFEVITIIGLCSCLFLPVMVIIFCLLPKMGAMMVKFVVFLGTKLRLIKYPEKNKYKFTKNVLLNARSLKKLASSPVVFISTLLVSLAENLSMSSIAYFTLRFFGFDMVGIGGFYEWLMIVQICILLYAGISFIPTPGNAGAADLSFYLLFTTALSQTSNSSPFVAMLTWRILSFYSLIIIGFVFVNIKKNIDKAKQKEKVFLSN